MCCVEWMRAPPVATRTYTLLPSTTCILYLWRHRVLQRLTVARAAQCEPDGVPARHRRRVAAVANLALARNLQHVFLFGDFGHHATRRLFGIQRCDPQHDAEHRSRPGARDRKRVV